jgi:hypothetical protein
VFEKIASAVACVFAGAALAVSLTHHGPDGPRGPSGPRGQIGQTGQNAEVAHLGVCWQYAYDSTTGDVSSVSLSAPDLTDGVPSCPSGSFISIVPQPLAQSINGG